MEHEERVVRDGSNLLANGGADHVGGGIALGQEGGRGGKDGVDLSHRASGRGRGGAGGGHR